MTTGNRQSHMRSHYFGSRSTFLSAFQPGQPAHHASGTAVPCWRSAWPGGQAGRQVALSWSACSARPGPRQAPSAVQGPAPRSQGGTSLASQGRQGAGCVLCWWAAWPAHRHRPRGRVGRANWHRGQLASRRQCSSPASDGPDGLRPVLVCALSHTGFVPEHRGFLGCCGPPCQYGQLGRCAPHALRRPSWPGWPAWPAV